MRMQSKVALVTGSALGYKKGGPSIGSAISFKLASEGAKVVVIDILKEMGQRTADKIIEKGGEAIFVKTDVGKTEEVQRAIEMAKQTFGKLHCLVNCAASYERDIARNVVELSEDDWNYTINVNLNGYFRCAKYAIPLILQSGGGTIINISSGAAFKVLKDFSVYSVTKAAINALTRTLAIDFAPQIRTNTICPGFVKIANSEGDRSPEEIDNWHKSIAQGYPLKRVCTVEEIASVALFLACDDSSYINGQCIIVDGGRMIADTHEF
ncbi:MAG: SDR family NAD(P)-dependent oxidoreductase [Promethearchaeota archaeon]